ncbi:MAG: ATP-grasp domain-containing protein [Candidatus Eremiobacterota bacterium]
MQNRPVTFLCLASYFKGAAFMQELKRQGCRVLLLTESRLEGENWPRESIDEFFMMPALKQPDITNAVSYLARERHIDRIVALDDYDVETAAALREHLRSPGMGDTTARYFRDKLAMRVQAQDHGLPVPQFVHVLNYDDIREFMRRVPPPWMLKPRSEAGAVGIKKVEHEADLWATLALLGDRQSHYLMEAYVPGDVFHVDSIIYDRKMLYQIAHRYGEPPMKVSHLGGIFTTRTMSAAREGPLVKKLKELNEKVVETMGMVRGVTHAEFIRGHDGTVYFLELAARVGGAHIDRLVEAASGINLWAEWARLELAYLRGESYQVPTHRLDYAGMALCLARQEWPDLSGYTDPEIVHRIVQRHHAGLIVCSHEYDRVEELLENYLPRFAYDFLSVMPPSEKPGG